MSRFIFEDTFVSKIMAQLCAGCAQAPGSAYTRLTHKFEQMRREGRFSKSADMREDGKYRGDVCGFCEATGDFANPLNVAFINGPTLEIITGYERMGHPVHRTARSDTTFAIELRLDAYDRRLGTKWASSWLLLTYTEAQLLIDQEWFAGIGRLLLDFQTQRLFPENTVTNWWRVGPDYDLDVATATLNSASAWPMLMFSAVAPGQELKSNCGGPRTAQLRYGVTVSQGVRDAYFSGVMQRALDLISHEGISMLEAVGGSHDALMWIREYIPGRSDEARAALFALEVAG